MEGNGMGDEHLRYILSVEKEGSFSGAARSLDITQPALSAYVAKLEAKIGSPLFDRSYSPLRLTQTGLEYIAMVRDNARREREFERRVSDLSRLRTGSLAIGGSVFFISSYLPGVAANFARLYPGIRLRIVNGRVPELEKRTLDGQIDFFLSPSGIGADSFEYRQFAQERLLLCVPPDLSVNESLTGMAVPPEDVTDGSCVVKDYPEPSPSAFADTPFILLEEDLQIRSIADAWLGRHRQNCSDIIVDQVQTSYALTLAGAGVSVVPDSAIRCAGGTPVPKLYAFNRKLSVRGMSAAYKKGGVLSCAACRFLELLGVDSISGT